MPARFNELETRVKSLTEAAEAIAAARAELATLGDTAPALESARRRLEVVRALVDATAATTTAEERLAVLRRRDGGADPPDDTDAVRARQAAATAKEDAAGLAATAKAMRQRSDEAEANLLRTDALEGEADCPTCGQTLGDAFADVRQHRLAEVDRARKAHDEADKAARKAAKTASEAARLAEQAEPRRWPQPRHSGNDTRRSGPNRPTCKPLCAPPRRPWRRPPALARDAGVADADLPTTQADFAEAQAADRRASTLQGQLAERGGRRGGAADRFGPTR